MLYSINIALFGSEGGRRVIVSIKKDDNGQTTAKETLVENKALRTRNKNASLKKPIISIHSKTNREAYLCLTKKTEAMKKLITICALFFLAAGIQLNAQTTEPSTTTTTESKVATTPVGCHGGAMKPGCCKAGEQVKAEVQSKKSKKSKKACCAEAGSANCCANKGNHAGQPCHPGCTMPCCAPKEEKSNQ